MFTFKLTRRHWISVVLAVTCSAPALAADPIKLVVPFPAGGALDYTGRQLAEKLRPLLNRDFIVENKAGANGNIGASTVASAEPDGNTLLVTADGVVTVNPHMYKKSTLKLSDLRPIAMVATLPQLLVVPASSPAKSVADLIALGKKRELSYSSGGVGSGGHLAMAYLSELADIKTLHVPYQGGAPALTALLGQQVDSAFLVLPSAIAQIQSGKLRALAISSAERSPQLPDVPTVAESGLKEFVVQQAYLMMAPARTSDAQINAMGSALSKVVGDPTFKQGLAERGMTPLYMDATKTAAWLNAESARWKKVITTNQISE